MFNDDLLHLLEESPRRQKNAKKIKTSPLQLLQEDFYDFHTQDDRDYQRRRKANRLRRDRDDD